MKANQASAVFRCPTDAPTIVLAGLLFPLFTATALGGTVTEQPYAIEWIRQLGTEGADYGWSVSVDGVGNAFLTGQANRDLGGPYAGRNDAFLAKYDTVGNLLWTTQLGTAGDDVSYSVAVFGANDVFISGMTEGNLGGPRGGSLDAFLAKYDTSGDLLWSYQLGAGSDDAAFAVAVDKWGNAFVGGRYNGSVAGPKAGGHDAFVAKYSESGDLLWNNQNGAKGFDVTASLAVDGAGNVYSCGFTEGSLGGTNAGSTDAFLVKYSNSGTVLWSEQLGTSTRDESYSVAIDGVGNAYISGATLGDLGGTNAGQWDTFLAKYDTSGSQLWIQQLGSSESDHNHGMTVDDRGNAYITGVTSGDLGGPDTGAVNAFVAKYDTSGNLLWTKQFGTAESEFGRSIAVDGMGNVYVAGETNGSFGAPNPGHSDAFLVKLSPVPEPATLFPTVLALVTMALAATNRHRARR